jgi:hypothetical protein
LHANSPKCWLLPLHRSELQCDLDGPIHRPHQRLISVQKNNKIISAQLLKRKRHIRTNWACNTCTRLKTCASMAFVGQALYMPSWSCGSSKTYTSLVAIPNIAALFISSLVRMLPIPSKFPFDKQRIEMWWPARDNESKVGVKNITSSSGCAITSTTLAGLQSTAVTFDVDFSHTISDPQGPASDKICSNSNNASAESTLSGRYTSILVLLQQTVDHRHM